MKGVKASVAMAIHAKHALKEGMFEKERKKEMKKTEKGLKCENEMKDVDGG